MPELPEQTRTTGTIWRYVSSPKAVADAVHNLPDFESLERGHARFTYTSFVSDRSLKVRDLRVVNEHIQYTYDIELFHYGKDVIVICSKKEIADSIRQGILSRISFRSVELDIEALTKAHPDMVTRLYVRLEGNRSLHAVSFYGRDILRSHLYQEMGTATYLSVTLEGALGCPMGSLASFNAEGTFSADSVLTDDEKLSVVKGVLSGYERTHG